MSSDIVTSEDGRTGFIVEAVDRASPPVLIMMLGRGRVGKTATATALIQYYRALGRASCLECGSAEREP